MKACSVLKAHSPQNVTSDMNRNGEYACVCVSARAHADSYHFCIQRTERVFQGTGTVAIESRACS